MRIYIEGEAPIIPLEENLYPDKDTKLFYEEFLKSQGFLGGESNLRPAILNPLPANIVLTLDGETN